MVEFLRYLSLVLLLALLMITALVLAITREGFALSGEMIGVITLIVMACAVTPALVLLTLWLRASEDLDRAAVIARHLAAGDTGAAAALAGDRRESSVSLRELALEMERSRDAAAEEKKALWQVMDALGEGIVAIDANRRIVLLNQAVSDLFGTPRAVEGKPFIEVVRNQPLASAFDRALEGTGVSARAIIATGPSQRQIEMRVFPVRDVSSSIAAVALLIDLTEIDRLQRIRRDFIADFSHEVRTPLAGLRASVESLEAGVSEREQAAQLYRIVSRQLHRLERLVSDLSQLNEIESGEARLERERVDLLRLVADLRDDYADEAASRGVAIELAGESLSVIVDVLRMQQVFSNLIDNALRHSRTSDRIRISIRREEGEAIVEVRDFGEGIPPEEQPLIFHRLYRVEKSRSAPRGEGSGLGLAIAKHLVLRHGGRIGVSSSVGEGASFWVALPLESGIAP